MDRARELIDREREQLRLLMLAMVLFALSLSLMMVRDSKMRNRPVAPQPDRASNIISAPPSSLRFDSTRFSMTEKRA